MPKVTYVQPDGSRASCQLSAGDSVMDGALDNHIPGILGQCGGGCTCATCHCYVPPGFLEHLPPAQGDELEILAYVRDRRPNSRLACQIRVDDDLDGLVIEVPPDQA